MNLSKSFGSCFIALMLMSFSTLVHAQLLRSAEHNQTNEAVLSLLEYTEDTIEWRKKFLDMTKKLKKHMDENQSKIRGDQYLSMQELAKDYVHHIHGPLKSIVEDKENFLLFRDFFEIQTLKPTSITDSYRSESLDLARRNNRGNGIRFRTIKVKKYSVNPFDKKGEELLKKFKTQFAAKLVLLDNYSMALSEILDHSYLRRVLLWDLEVEHQDVRNTLWNTWKEFYHDYQNPTEIYQALEIFEKSQITMVYKDLYHAVLDEMITKSHFFAAAKEKRRTMNFFVETIQRMKLMNARQRDDIGFNVENIVYQGSKLFGNISGSFYKGVGKLYHYSDEQLEEIEHESRALDVIFDKTGFRLTDSFIPGHFTHAAIWAGTEDELKELGVWEELPALYERAKRNYNYKGQSFQDAIRTKHYIIEALRPGVQINNLRHFIDIDDLVFLRPKDCEDGKRVNDEKGNPKCLTKEMKKAYLIEAFKQIGKDYDFNFDVNTRERIVCSELVYRTFLDTNFETDRMLGRHTIISDQIIPHADDKDDLMYPTLVIINGVKVESSTEEKQELLKLLKAENYPAFEEKTGISTDY